MSSSTTARARTHGRRRALRVAAAALTAAAALSLTACSGSDAAGGKPAGHADTGAAAAGSGASAAAQGSSSRADSGVPSAAKGSTAKESTAGTRSGGTHTGAATASSPVHTQPLADGSTAEIYRLAGGHYRAKIVSRGAVLATLETSDQQVDAGLDANDMFVLLTMGGEVRSWMGGGRQGPGTFTLAGGWTAKVTKAGEQRYRAQIIGRDGSVDATLETKGHDVGVDANGVSIVLSTGGIISAHG
ncbi:hypothetical protein MUU72_05470 [Streptomyces sp. RS10V-4]|uniref:hypothetical protein n=1 Tax=Streptomyces rhizoryzae TaxID=2932493 RepID=UPI002002A0D3|nr:hypothetical protein [Streptomyces rhizoryzae]MCK7622561.1 hypothetical protein [Streptomyces rhizoryzae]